MTQLLLSLLIAFACAVYWLLSIEHHGIFNLFLVGASGWGLAAHRQWELWRRDVPPLSDAPDISQVKFPDPGPGPFGFGDPSKKEDEA